MRDSLSSLTLNCQPEFDKKPYLETMPGQASCMNGKSRAEQSSTYELPRSTTKLGGMWYFHVCRTSFRLSANHRPAATHQNRLGPGSCRIARHAVCRL